MHKTAGHHYCSMMLLTAVGSLRHWGHSQPGMVVSPWWQKVSASAAPDADRQPDDKLEHVPHIYVIPRGFWSGPHCWRCRIPRMPWKHPTRASPGFAWPEGRKLRVCRNVRMGPITFSCCILCPGSPFPQTLVYGLQWCGTIGIKVLTPLLILEGDSHPVLPSPATGRDDKVSHWELDGQVPVLIPGDDTNQCPGCPGISHEGLLQLPAEHQAL